MTTIPIPAEALEAAERTYDIVSVLATQSAELIRQDAEITALRAEVAALKGQHKGLVLQNALLRQRPDLPVDRIPAAQEVDALRAEVAKLREALHDINMTTRCDKTAAKARAALKEKADE